MSSPNCLERDKCRILIVDDEAEKRQLLIDALDKVYDLEIAQDGNEAIQQCHKWEPDLILMDVIMPDMNGYDACRAIKSVNRFADLPIIFLTGADNPESEVLGLKVGGIDYLTKPVDPILLSMRIANHLEMKKKNDLVKQQRDLLATQKAELEEALARIKSLEGIIPICMYCKNIRNAEETWERLEEYIEKHSDARFSHGLCHDCKEIHFPDLNI